MSSLKKDDGSDFGGDDHQHSRPVVDIEQPDPEAVVGAKTVEASAKVWGKYSKWALFISIGLASYIYSLDGTTTYTYLSFATSAFGEHSLISSIQVAQSIIIAVGKPVIAKLSDVTSRATAYLAVLIFYVVGYIVIASAHNVESVAGGIIIYACGYTGLQLLTSIIIADITTLKWRGLVSGLTSAPFIINAFVGSNISAQVLQHAGWRWGYGMFAILVPAALSPLIITLFWGEQKAKKLGLVEEALRRAAPGYVEPAKQHYTLRQRVWRFAEALDAVGLLLVGAAVALILLPLTLSQTAKGGWSNGSIIAMLVIGCVLLPIALFWDLRYAKHPAIAPRFLKNLTVNAAMWIGFFDFVSFYLSNTYLYSFVFVVKPWSLTDMNYFSQTQTVALTVFGITAGFIMRFVHRYKPILIIGLAIRLLGVGLMIHSRGADSSDAEIVWTQILQGMGGGFASVCTSVASQAAVTHADVAMTTAVVLLWTEIGGSVGSAIAGAIWTNTMPDKLAKHLPDVPEDLRAELFGSITDVVTYPRGDPIREGVIAAYSDVMKILVIAATVLSVIPLLISLIMPNWYLGDTQNAVDEADLTGDLADAPTPEERRN
ncbi:drug:h+ antiporter [Panus rudis PR-1116 ss-1]|nr:drug:h+ antiporter [Panus rudis PR-1116 ss-1]